jgi:hypothetical protein
MFIRFAANDAPFEWPLPGKSKGASGATRAECGLIDDGALRRSVSDRGRRSFGRSTLIPRLLTIADGPDSNSVLACRY